MEQSAIDKTRSSHTGKHGGGRRRGSREKRRVVGVLTAALALIAAGAAIYDDMHARTGAAACMRKAASDEHAMLEAFFQNPLDENAWVQIERACAK